MVDQKIDWAQKVVIVRLWISIENLADDPRIVDGVRLVLDSFKDRFTNPLDAAATHAAHVVCLSGNTTVMPVLTRSSSYGSVLKQSTRKVILKKRRSGPDLGCMRSSQMLGSTMRRF